jgi:hypothetical protein
MPRECRANRGIQPDHDGKPTIRHRRERATRNATDVGDSDAGSGTGGGLAGDLRKIWRREGEYYFTNLGDAGTGEDPRGYLA